MVNIIDDRIIYVENIKEPIASDSYIIKGHDSTWIYDVSSSDEASREIDAIEGRKNIVISHFHPDHLSNISRIDLSDAMVYVSKQTYKHCDVKLDNKSYKKASCEDGCNKDLNSHDKNNIIASCSEIIDGIINIDDGMKFKIFPISSSHAKGCLGLEVGSEYAFIGDAIYPTYKDNHKMYNIQLLKEQIDIIEGLKAQKVFISHSKKPYVRREVVVAFLKSIYAKRSSDSNFIFEKLF